MFIPQGLSRSEPFLFENVRVPLRKAVSDLITFLFAAVMMLGFCGVARAQTPPGTHLQIENVFVNFAAKKITILGQMFNFGPGPLTVTLADVGNITPDCTPNFAVTPQTITCDLSGGVPPFPSAGDYLLTVSNGSGTSQIDVWDLTIGAVGPVGATGPIGPTGPVGATGPVGSTGPVGATGPIGPTGPVGATGPAGATGAVGATGPRGPSGASGITGLEGMSCPSGQSVTGFDASGKIICSGAAAACTTHVFTFSMMSSPGGETTGADWPGLSVTMTDPADSNCGVTVGEPSGNISLVGTLGDAWHVISNTGYTSCSPTNGESNSGVFEPDCSGLNAEVFGAAVPAMPNVTSGRPSCSTSVCPVVVLGTGCTGNGIATDTFQVTCTP